MFKNLFKAPVDYTTELDALQFAREAKRKATAHFPEDSSTWTDAQWAIADEWEAKIPPLDNPDCICKGIVTSIDRGGWMTLCLMLDPPPRHPALPKEIRIHASVGMHSPSEFMKLRDLSVGDRTEIRGVFYPPIFFVEEGSTGEWFKLKETRDFQKRHGY